MASRKHRVCAFCGGDATAFGGRLGRLEGPFSVSKNTFETVYVHNQCAVWSPNISQNVDLTLRSVGKEVRRARNLRCSACGRNGAAIGCRVPSCSNCYHLPCAIDKCCSFNFGLYLMACPEHAALFKNELNAQANDRNRGPLAHLKLSGSHQQHRHTAWGAAAGSNKGLKKRSRMTAAQIGDHIDAVKAAYQSLVEELNAQDATEPDDAIIAAKDAKRMRKATQQLAPTYLAPVATTAKQSLKPGPAGPGQLEAQTASKTLSLPQQQALTAHPVPSNHPASDGFTSIGGLLDVKRQLKEMVLIPLMYPELSSKLGMQIPRGILLHGRPGTGKTAIVRALAAECARASCQAAMGGGGGDGTSAAAARPVALFARKGTDCLGKYAGDAELHLRLLFEMAAASAPSIIFFDELDGLVPARSVRSSSSDQIFASVVSVLLALMDGLRDRGQVLVIGATNRPDSIDPALRRPGRFDREVYFNLPTQEDRQAILSVHTRRWEQSQQPSQELLQQLAAATDGWAGADLQSLTAAALMSAVRRTAPNLVATLEQKQRYRQQKDKQQEGGQQTAVPAVAAINQQQVAEATPDHSSPGQNTEQQRAQHQPVQDHPGLPVEHSLQQKSPVVAADSAAAVLTATAAAQPKAMPESVIAGRINSGSKPTTAAAAAGSPEASGGFLAALNTYVAEQKQQHQQQRCGTVSWLSRISGGSPGVPESVVAEAIARAAARISPAAPSGAAVHRDSKTRQSQVEQQQGVHEELQTAGPQQQSLQDGAPQAAPGAGQGAVDVQQQVSHGRSPCTMQQLQEVETKQADQAAPSDTAAPQKLDIQADDWWTALRSAGPPASKREMQSLAACNPAAALPAVLVPLLLPAFARVVLLLDRWLLLLADGVQQLTSAASAVVSGSHSAVSYHEREQRCLQFEQLLQQFAAVEKLPDLTIKEHGLTDTSEEHTATEPAAAGPGDATAAVADTSGQSSPGQSTSLLHHSLPSYSSCHRLLLSGHGAAGQSELASSVLKLLDTASAAAVYTLSLPCMLLLGDGDVGVGVVAGVREAVQRAGRGQLLVLYLPRIELWALEPVRRKEQSTGMNIARTAASAARQHSLPGIGLEVGKASGVPIGSRRGAMHGAVSSGSSSGSSSDDDSDIDDAADSSVDAMNGFCNSTQVDPNNMDFSNSVRQDSTAHRLQRPLRSGSRRRQQQCHKLSPAWGVFEQQLAALPAAGPCVLLLATSHIAADDLPVEVQHIFDSSIQQQQDSVTYLHGGQECHMSGMVQTCGCCDSSDVSRQPNKKAAAEAALRETLDRAARAAAAHHLQVMETPESALMLLPLPRESHTAEVSVHQSMGSRPAGAATHTAAAGAETPPMTVQHSAAGIDQHQHTSQLSLQQLNAAQQAQAHHLFSQVQQQLQVLSSRLLADPAIRRAVQNPIKRNSRAARNARQQRQNPLQALPLAAVCLKAVGGWYCQLDEFQADFAAAVDNVRKGHADSKCYSSAVAAAAYMQDVADTACADIASQLRLYEPWNRKLLVAAADSWERNEQHTAPGTVTLQQEHQQADPTPARLEATPRAPACNNQQQVQQVDAAVMEVGRIVNHSKRDDSVRKLQSLAAAYIEQWQQSHMRQQVDQQEAARKISCRDCDGGTCWASLHSAVQRYCSAAAATAQRWMEQPS